MVGHRDTRSTRNSPGRAPTITPEDRRATVESVCRQIEDAHIFDVFSASLLERVAWVESSHGLDEGDPAGGIWRVPRELFCKTQMPECHPYLPGYVGRIFEAFGIEWVSVQWEQIQQPLYSALAAGLLMSISSHGTYSPKAPVGSTVEAQARFWRESYTSTEHGKFKWAENLDRFIAKVNANGGTGEERQGATAFRKSSSARSREMERYYCSPGRRAPHVVGHYAAATRVGGLTEHEMANRIAVLSVGGKKGVSPYAQPLVPIFLNKKKPYHLTGKVKPKEKGTRVREPGSTASGLQLEARNSETFPHRVSSSTTIAESGFRKRSPPPRAFKSAPQTRLLNFSIPGVSLPDLNSNSFTKGKICSLTMDHHRFIRSKVNSAYTEYKQNLFSKKKSINARNLKQMDIGLIPSQSLRARFTSVAEDYGYIVMRRCTHASPAHMHST